MARGRAWTREELLLALNLYQRLDFGRQHQGNPDVVALAGALGRTAGSVAMKLNNFTSLDPAERARGIKGLRGASARDREVWAAFEGFPAETVAESEALWRRRVAEPGDPRDPLDEVLDEIARIGETDRVAVQTVRHGQRFFRRTVLAIYEGRCCLTGNPVPELLAASHIVPWAESREHRLDPGNGLCLARTQDAAFDRGLITFDEDRRMVMSRRLRDFLPAEAIRAGFEAFEGRPLRRPLKHPPREEFLARHRERFRG